MANLISSKYDLITTLMNTGKSGTVTFVLPNANGLGFQKKIVGFIIGDVSVKLSNKWQAILPSIDAITLASQIIETSENAVAWLRSTQSAWMGSEPLRLTIPFYLFSMDASSNINNQINGFRQLMSPYKNSGDFSVKIHGGYKPTVFQGEWQGEGATQQAFSSGVDIQNELAQGQGLIQIQVGNQFRLSRMLLEDLTVDQSTIQVVDGNPLYAKVTASFKSNSVLYSQEIVDMFTVQPTKLESSGG